MVDDGRSAPNEPARATAGAIALHLQLLRSSSFFAQSAAGAYTAEAWELYYLHLATAVEQLVKAVLAKAHPSLIADTRGGFDSLLHLCGLGDRARVPDFVAAVRTVSATEALQRVQQLVDGYRPPSPDVLLLLEIRNGLVHSGRLARSQSEAILGAVGQYIDALLPLLDATPGEYWGDSADLVRTHSQRRLGELEASFHRKLGAARARYRRLIEPMEKEERRTYIAALADIQPSQSFEEAPANCPACGKQGTLSGYPDPQWEADWDSEGGDAYISGAYVKAIVIQGTSFSCRVCGLHLDSVELGLAGLDSVTLTDEDFDVSSASEHFEVDAIATDEDW